MNEALRQMKIAAEASQKAKNIISAHVKVARILMKDTDLHALKDLALEVSSNGGTIEGELAEFSRIGFGADRFAVVKEKAEAKG